MAEPFIQLKIDEQGLREASHILRAIPGGFDRVVRRSMGRAIDKAFTMYKRGIVSATTLRSGRVGKAMTKRKSGGSAALLADPVRFPLGVFQAKQTRQTKAVGRKISRGMASRFGAGIGVRYRISRVTKVIEGGFIATAIGKKGGGGGDLSTTSAQRRAEWESEGLTAAEIRKKSHRGVFKRRGAPRLPIGEKYGPSLWRIAVNTPGLSNVVPEKTSIDLTKLINDQMGVELRKWVK